METLPIPRTTITQLVCAYMAAQNQINEAFRLLATARDGLVQAYGEPKRSCYGFDLAHLISQHHVSLDHPEELMKHLQRDAWRTLAERMELRRVMSSARVKELDHQLQTGEGLPAITEADIMAVLEGTFASLGTYREEAVKEVFEFLRPRHSRYKTNTEFEIGKRVILGYAVEPKYDGGWRTCYQREQELRCLDNTFHALDGKGLIPTYGGPLCDAIGAVGSKGVGETIYFKFRCFHNHNLHIEFRRLDLLAQLNQTAGGNRLKPEHNS
jgi:hypothetical protein